MPFSPEQLSELTAHGISEEEAERQLALLRTPPAPAALRRPCTVGDGLLRLGEEERRRLSQSWTTRSNLKKAKKFIPASGAATRMFKSLHALKTRRSPETLSELRTEAEAGDGDAQLAVSLFDRIGETAVAGPLAAALGRSVEECLERDEYLPLIDGMLDDEPGLGLSQLPKGLIPFHRYPEGSRTATEEHLIEGLGYLPEHSSRHFHFTVSPAHQERFDRVAAQAQARHAEAGDPLEITFSIQDPATDTLAIDQEGTPLATADGHLVFRPAGHGALLTNLSRLDADIVFVKNIDNVMPVPSQSDTIRWKRALAGLALEVQERVFAQLEALDDENVDLAAVWSFVDAQLPLVVPPGVREGSRERQRDYLIDRLHRPLRVCGMVKNEGEPGGGPFWVEDADGGFTPQIVESAQVDLDAAESAGIWSRSTHFNPVDLVCCLKDRNGQPFDLDRFCDPGASFVAAKSYEGRPITVLERPGLWNGSMAGWNTLFVEVPISTFSPVKTILDLLKPQHQVHSEES